jgi:hypothetical protein
MSSHGSTSKTCAVCSVTRKNTAIAAKPRKAQPSGVFQNEARPAFIVVSAAR